VTVVLLKILLSSSRFWYGCRGLPLVESGRSKRPGLRMVLKTLTLVGYCRSPGAV
jgi:hypothetical protein